MNVSLQRANLVRPLPGPRVDL